jgi:hypothetical protein
MSTTKILIFALLTIIKLIFIIPNATKREDVMKNIELTQQQVQERKQVWDKLRKDHKRDKPKDDAERVALRDAYRIARNNLYREYFKIDRPEEEALIDKDEALKKMAETEMRKIVFRFYRGNGKGMEDFVFAYSKEYKEYLNQAFYQRMTIIGTWAFTSSVMIYDIYQGYVNHVTPLGIVNILACGAIYKTCTLATLTPPDYKWFQSLSDYVNASEYKYRQPGDAYWADFKDRVKKTDLNTNNKETKNETQR